MLLSLRNRTVPKADLLPRVAALLPAIAVNAAARDEDGAFPHDDLRALRDAGALSAPLPHAYGGHGLGTEPDGASPLADLLGLVGRGSLPLGRVFEGHVNALSLVFRYGDPAKAERAARDAHEGELFGVWNTDPPAAPLGLLPHPQGWRLAGRKVLCSGAGFVTRALVTAARPDGARLMLVVPLDDPSRADLSAWTAQGMRASATGQVDFDQLVVSHEAILGEPGDYERQPAFSGGAWRVLAVIAGGIDALADAHRDHLLVTGRAHDPHQRARAGRLLIAQESARLWVREAAARAEDWQADADETVAFVNLARGAVEAAATEAIALVQRSVGLAGLMRPHPVERLCRDLATYLRQPAPDAALTEGAAWFLANGGIARTA